MPTCVVGPQFQNLTLICCLLTCRRTSEIFECCPKTAKQMLLKKYWSLRQGVLYSLIILEAKSEEKHLKKIYYFLLQKQFCPFLERKKCKTNFNLKFTFWQFFYVLEGFCKFSKKKKFKVPVIKKSTKVADFLKLNFKIYTWSAKMSCFFEKVQKSAKSLHPCAHCKALQKNTYVQQYCFLLLATHQTCSKQRKQ